MLLLSWTSVVIAIVTVLPLFYGTYVYLSNWTARRRVKACWGCWDGVHTLMMPPNGVEGTPKEVSVHLRITRVGLCRIRGRLMFRLPDGSVVEDVLVGRFRDGSHLQCRYHKADRRRTGNGVMFLELSSDGRSMLGTVAGSGSAINGRRFAANVIYEKCNERCVQCAPKTLAGPPPSSVLSLIPQKKQGSFQL